VHMIFVNFFVLIFLLLVCPLVGENWCQESCLKTVRDILKKLSNLHRARNLLKQYRYVFYCLMYIDT